MVVRIKAFVPKMHPRTEIQEASLEDAEGEVGTTGVGGSPITSLTVKLWMHQMATSIACSAAALGAPMGYSGQ
jgi:hypothetical protein